MKMKKKWCFTTSCVLMIVYGLFAAIFMGIKAMNFFEEIRYSIWMDVSSPGASLMVGAVAGVFTMLSGLYGLFSKDKKMRWGGCVVISSITFAYYIAALLLCGGETCVIITSCMGIVLSLMLVAMTHFSSRKIKQKNIADDASAI